MLVVVNVTLFSIQSIDQLINQLQSIRKCEKDEIDEKDSDIDR